MLRGFVLVLLAVAFAAPAAAGAPADGVWVDGAVHALITGPPPAGTTHGRALYVIAPISTRHALHPLATARLHGFGAHDHVIGLAQSSSAFHGACELTLVVPGPKGIAGKTIETRRTLTPAGIKPLLYAARLDNKLLPLNSAARVQHAKELRLATLIATHNLVACSVSQGATG